MPYIQEWRREALQGGETPQSAGELNYLITTAIQQYLESRPKKNYAEYNAVVGVLECAKLELYRRAIVPYETKKITENGDCY